MIESPIVVVYKTRNRDLTPLQETCNNLKISLCAVEHEEDLKKEINKGAVLCIIVPIDSDENGGNYAREFANVAAKILQPEDADVAIIYSAVGYTPPDWPGTLDPKSIRSYDDPQFIADDKAWRYTIEKLKSMRKRFSYRRNQDIVKIEIEKDANAPFPSEAGYLLRAAFKEMSRISIGFPRQGLSGSIACVVQPYDAQGNKCKCMFAKVYPDHDKGQSEIERYLRFVVPYIDSGHCPRYQDFRRYRGKAYSLMVTDLVEGPDSKLLTFWEMLLSPNSSVGQMRNLITEIVSIMDKWPLGKATGSLNLLNEYLSHFLAHTDKRLKLESENVCHRWFGSVADGLSLEEKIRCSLPRASLEGTCLRICHGDIHGDNIMVKNIGGRLSPVFIDFSRTGETHSLKDLVTLESDMIVRGLNGVEGLNDKNEIRSFLESLAAEEAESWSFNEQEALGTSEMTSCQFEKVQSVIRVLRRNAFFVHGVKELEYLGAALLKTLEVLSYGKLPYDQNERATAYVTYLCDRIQLLSNA